MQRTRVAVFDLTGCEGCEFHVLSREDVARELFRDFEITNWRLLTEREQEECDIAVVEGAVTTPEQADLLRRVRDASRTVVAIGACACTGNIFALPSPERRLELAARIYGPGYPLRARFLAPIRNFIAVDHSVPGCPPDAGRLITLLKGLRGAPGPSPAGTVVLPDLVAKIEGHGRLKIDFRRREVEFDVVESERLVEGILLGRPYAQAPSVAARVCGICSAAHDLCSWMAIESALGVVPSPGTVAARKILLAAQAAKSHLMHLFFLVLPDQIGERRAEAMARLHPAEFAFMAESHRICERALAAIAGSTAFPVATALGGFRRPPDAAELRSLRDAVRAALGGADALVSFFASLPAPSLRSAVRPFAPEPPGGEYPLYGAGPPPAAKALVRSGSSARLGLLPDGTAIRVGALARIALFGARLNPRASAALKRNPLDPADPFQNNLAQAVEIVHYLEEIARVVEGLPDGAAEGTAAAEPDRSRLPAQGEAFVEAPRGVLVHRAGVGRGGEIASYGILSPTQLNLAALESDARRLVRERTDLDEGGLKQAVETLLRASDPCITCAVH